MRFSQLARPRFRFMSCLPGEFIELGGQNHHVLALASDHSEVEHLFAQFINDYSGCRMAPDGRDQRRTVSILVLMDRATSLVSSACLAYV